MTTIEINVLAHEDEEFVINILTALAQKQIIEFDLVDSFPAEGPPLTEADLLTRLDKAEQGRS
ncbi:hypothetical protein F5984_03775 [Rudanella paleaurantiibacter]|uniref:Uncharacterized protein n=1 Tax=Rudanella paleaurantiibacter TaxID=2614655 RepID=A0A7J5U659_9BACT|nr:hypothetical protein [Rudanella paleaurantiibacter]KAB7733067.1 hypothetical protein F5984_03775 [Rudanella paleaurantiibacter]